MSTNGTQAETVDERIAKLEAKRAERKAESAKARAIQYEVDLEAFMRLEEEHGEDSVTALHVKGFVPGLPTLIVVKSPGGTSYYNRYKDQVFRAKGNQQAIGGAQEMLGTSCIVYPTDDETRKRMFTSFPGAALSAGQAAIKLVELEAQEEKKD